MEHHDADSTYLVEHYRPGVGTDQLGLCVAEVREALGTGGPSDPSIRVVCAVVVPADEALLVLVRATSEQHVAEAFARAGVHVDRISVAVPEVGPPLGATPRVAR